jgi:serine/threonine protein kinase
LGETAANGFVRDIFKGLLYLGERGIVHRDLKIANVFIHNNIAKIADFGFAKYTNKYLLTYLSSNFKDLDIGSPLYMSPEGMIDHIYGMKTDIWAFGVIIY